MKILGSVKATDRGFTHELELPCGQCQGCRLAKKREWAIRCMHEAQMHVYPKGHPSAGSPRTCFITLTYDKEHLPEDQSVRVRDWQLFAKRLRKACGKFRFLACGEYGDENLRPHYHACIFGLDFSEDKELLKQDGEFVLYTSPRLARIWGKGFVTIGSLTFDSASYVAGYVMKKMTGFDADEHYVRVNADGDRWYVAREFATMSRRPGLGADWFHKFAGDCYPDDCVIAKGQEFPVPKYYDRLFERVEPAVVAELKELRVAKALERSEDNSVPRLLDREKVLAARLQSKGRI